MPKTIEYAQNGVREVYSRKDCHSCWECAHCIDMVDPTHYMCRAKSISSKNDWRFPFDNTKCEEFKHKYGEKDSNQ